MGSKYSLNEIYSNLLQDDPKYEKQPFYLITEIAVDHEIVHACPPRGVYPSVYAFNAGLGNYAIALYVMCGVTIAILALQYGFLVGHFIAHVPKVKKGIRSVLGFIGESVSIKQRCGINNN